jgi:hypothetical protein
MLEQTLGIDDLGRHPDLLTQLALPFLSQHGWAQDDQPFEIEPALQLSPDEARLNRLS